MISDINEYFMFPLLFNMLSMSSYLNQYQCCCLYVQLDLCGESLPTNFTTDIRKRIYKFLSLFIKSTKSQCRPTLYNHIDARNGGHRL